MTIETMGSALTCDEDPCTITCTSSLCDGGIIDGQHVNDLTVLCSDGCSRSTIKCPTGDYTSCAIYCHDCCDSCDDATIITGEGNHMKKLLLDCSGSTACSRTSLTLQSRSVESLDIIGCSSSFKCDYAKCNGQTCANFDCCPILPNTNPTVAATSNPSQHPTTSNTTSAPTTRVTSTPSFTPSQTIFTSSSQSTSDTELYTTSESLSVFTSTESKNEISGTIRTIFKETEEESFENSNEKVKDANDTSNVSVSIIVTMIGVTVLILCFCGIAVYIAYKCGKTKRNHDELRLSVETKGADTKSTAETDTNAEVNMKPVENEPGGNYNDEVEKDKAQNKFHVFEPSLSLSDEIVSGEQEGEIQQEGNPPTQTKKASEDTPNGAASTHHASDLLDHAMRFVNAAEMDQVIADDEDPLTSR